MKLPLKPNTDEAISFLKKMHPLGPFHLTVISETERIENRTFDLGESDDMYRWINKHQGRSNIYFTVNTLRENIKHIKAKKGDVEEANCLHVDVDDLTALERIITYDPPPTAVLFSGGGFQAFWVFSKPSTDLLGIERLNQQIARDLGGDNCHNIDRIMRLPGTINVPNKKKKEAGRTPALAYVVEEATDWSLKYSIDEFVGTTTKLPATSIEVDDDQIRNDVRPEELPENLPPATLAIIMAGDDRGGRAFVLQP